MVKVQLVDIRVVAQVEFPDACLAYVKDVQLRVFCHVKALYHGAVDRDAAQLRASRRVQFAQAFVGVCLECLHLRIVREVE